MAKTDPASAKRERNKHIRWAVTIFLITIFISGLISLISDEVMASSSLGVAFLILFVIIFVGIIFDIIGMAVATAEEKPFHSMAARKVPGAQEAIRLLRNAERVSSICNDVVGDICGVVSGSASATIASLILAHVELDWPGGLAFSCRPSPQVSLWAARPSARPLPSIPLRKSCTPLEESCGLSVIFPSEIKNVRLCHKWTF